MIEIGSRPLTLDDVAAVARDDHPVRLAQCWGLRGRDWVFSDVTDEGLPLDVLEVHGAGQVGMFTAKLGKMKNPPRHDQVDGQAAFDAIGAAELTVFDATAALERAMKHLDAPSQRIPIEFFVGPGEVLHLPSNCPHSAEALEETVVLDIFSPPSERTGIDPRAH